MSEKRSMPVTIPATKAHRNFGELVRRAYSGMEHFIVEKDGLPVIALIPISEYQELMKERQRREERLERFRENTQAIGEALEEKGITQEQMMDAMEDIRQEVFREHYGKNQ